MGEPISIYFELDPSDPDQERAWEILEEWQSLGFPIQNIMTQALLRLAEAQDSDNNHHFPDAALLEQQVRQVLVELHSPTLEEIKHMVGTVQVMLKNLENQPPLARTDQPEAPAADAPVVSAALLNSLKKSMHRGMRLGDS